MRLYLSSFRLGNQPQRLVELVKGNNRAVVICNACDHLSGEERQIRVSQEMNALQALGFSTLELDLRHYFNNEQRGHELRALLETCGVVWVRGGNSFLLRRAMRASCFDEVIRDFLGRDALVYSGFSAGIDILGPSLRGVELVDDPDVVPAGYAPAIVWECLGLLPYVFTPHYKSDHPESADIDRLVQYYIDNHILFKALRDGEVMVVNGVEEEVIS